MELESGSPVVGVGAPERRCRVSGGFRWVTWAAWGVAEQRQRLAKRPRTHDRRHVSTTSLRTPIMTRTSAAHEVSKRSVRVARWSGERIGPTIIAVPHRGQAHVARSVGSVVTVAVGRMDAGSQLGCVRFDARAFLELSLAGSSRR
jgi:hypothetical protein